MDIVPTCPENYKLRKTKCKCVLKSDKKTKKKKIKLKLVEKIRSPIIKVKKLGKTRKRCPNGMRKNRKTGVCELKDKSKKNTPRGKEKGRGNDPLLQIPSSAVTQGSLLLTPPLSSAIPSKTTYVIPSNTPPNDEIMGNEIATNLESSQAKKSFSPAVHKQLQSLKTAPYKNFFGCVQTNNQGDFLEDMINTDLLINVGAEKNPTCVKYTTKEAQKLLLHNLNSNIPLNCSDIIAPQQLLSNCWFNTFFMAFLVSDKGRKFFRSFRQLMIEGIFANGTKIRSKKMRRALFLLNMAIEASYNIGNKTPELAKYMDTNQIIQSIHEGIPKQERQIYPWVAQTDEAGNPMLFYQELMYFLSNEELSIAEIYTDYFKKSLKKEISEMAHSENPPEIIAVIIDDKESHNVYKENQYAFTLSNDETIQYKLDSAIIRDTYKEHFCCMIHCNGKQYSFDGLSYRRMSPFEWLPLLNKNEIWEFEGSLWGSGPWVDTPIQWNFKKGYQILLYYRVK